MRFEGYLASAGNQILKQEVTLIKMSIPRRPAESGLHFTDGLRTDQKINLARNQGLMLRLAKST